MLVYQALYRKYRPNNLDEVVGQDVIIQTLKNEILHNKLTHAYLFTGPRGTGKTSVAKILAKTVNCTNLNGFMPCNKCVSCTQINQKQTTDIIEIDAASNNGVDEIRELKSKVNLVPSNSKYKVYIIDEVHMLTVGAFNALLKTLEEPPKHIIFILATTDPHKIPSTILSRCQRFDFKRISTPKIVERLKYIVKEEQIDIEEEALFEIARLSDGGMRDSISMLDQVVSFSEGAITLKDVHEVNGTLSQKDMKEFIENLFQGNLEYLFHKLDECNNSGKNFIKLTEEIILFLRNLLLYKTVPNYFKETNQNIAPYETFQNEINVENLVSMIQSFNSTINEMKNSNTPKMVLELQLIRLLENNECTKNDNLKKEESDKTISVPSTEPKKIKQKALKNTDEKHVKIKKESAVGSKKKVLKEEKREELNKLIQLRINNALAGFSRKEVQSLKQKEDLLHTYLLNPEQSKYVSMLLDGTLKAVGNHTIIYVYPNERLSNSFNEVLISLDELLTTALGETYHTVATDVDTWNQIKDEFNNKKKKYEYQEETIDLNTLFEERKESDGELENLFGDIVEYE